MSRLGLRFLLIKYLKRPDVFSPIVLVKRSFYFLPVKSGLSRNSYGNTWYTKESYYSLTAYSSGAIIEYKNLLTGDSIKIDDHYHLRIDMNFDVYAYPQLHASIEVMGGNRVQVRPEMLSSRCRELCSKFPRENILLNVRLLIRTISEFMNNPLVRDVIKYLASNLDEDVLNCRYDKTNDVVDDYNFAAKENNWPLFDTSMKGKPLPKRLRQFVE
jgi:hypothetical protein